MVQKKIYIGIKIISDKKVSLMGDNWYNL